MTKQLNITIKERTPQGCPYHRLKANKFQIQHLCYHPSLPCYLVIIEPESQIPKTCPLADYKKPEG